MPWCAIQIWQSVGCQLFLQEMTSFWTHHTTYHSHCTIKMMEKTLYLFTLRCRNPVCPDLWTIDKIQSGVVTHPYSCYAAHKQWLILMLFWVYGNFTVMRLSEETGQWTSCYLSTGPESLFLHWIGTIPPFFTAERQKHSTKQNRWTTWVIAGGGKFTVCINHLSQVIWDRFMTSTYLIVSPGHCNRPFLWKLHCNQGKNCRAILVNQLSCTDCSISLKISPQKVEVFFIKGPYLPFYTAPVWVVEEMRWSSTESCSLFHIMSKILPCRTSVDTFIWRENG